MIRINLLPQEAKGARREMNLSMPKVGELVVPVMVLAIVSLIVLGTAFAQRARIGTLTRQIAQVDEQSRELAPQIARVNRLAQERAELDLRLGIISKLQHGRTSTVHMMDELSNCLPDHLWLTSAIENGTGLTLEGATFSNLVVSDFMSRLERSPMFASVELDVAERAQVADHDVVKFRVTCQVTPDEPAN